MLVTTKKKWGRLFEGIGRSKAQTEASKWIGKQVQFEVYTSTGLVTLVGRVHGYRTRDLTVLVAVEGTPFRVPVSRCEIVG